MNRLPVKTKPACRDRLAAGAALAGLLLLAAQVPAHGQSPGTLLQAELRARYSPAQVDELARPLFQGFEAPRSRLAVDGWDIRYASTDFDGSGAVIRAQLFVPVYTAPADRPVLVFGSGTTGVADACAPSLEQPEQRRWGYYRANMLAYAALGFITILPDYLGFNDPQRPQRYFSHAAEAHVLLDAARAVFRFFERRDFVLRPAPAVFTAGYSQGGHAAFAAADLQRRYAPEIPLSGVIGFAATTDVGALLREGPYYAPYILYSYYHMYGPATIDPSHYLLEKWSRTLEADAQRMCVDEFQAYYPFEGRQLYRPELYSALHGGDLAGRFPALAAVLRDNNSGLSGHRLPALVIQGDDDVIVTTKTQDRFVEQLSRAGSEVRYLVLPGVRHRYTRPAGFASSVEWIEAVFRGLPSARGGQ